jgi:nucleoside-diphosphate-sugar epimerase
MAHYLVTGAAGFIAARVCEMLLDEGHTVTGVDNMCPVYDLRLKEYRLDRLKARPGFTWKNIDISNWEDVQNLSGGQAHTDAIINLAARAGVRSSVIDPWAYINTNITGTVNMLELARRDGIKKFILASSSSVYGSNNPMPFREDANTDQPMQPYAASKKGAEAMCYAYHFLHQIDVTVFRYFTVYGPAARPDMAMFRLTQWITEEMPVRINGDGEQSRGFTYVDDIARGTIAGLRPLGYEIINLGGHEVIKINELVHLLENKIGNTAEIVHMPMHPADALGNQADVNKARVLLGWEPEVNLREGVGRMVDWYMAERSWVSRVSTE